MTNSQKLKPYQVGENDIVLAVDAESAHEVMINEVGADVFYGDKVEVFEVSLSTELHHEDGTISTTIGEYIKDMTEPQYLVGWE